MAKFYAEICGRTIHSKPIHRLGHNGQAATVASWKGAVRVEAYLKDGVEYVRVRLRPWRGSDTRNFLLYDGPMSGYGEYVSDFFPSKECKL